MALLPMLLAVACTDKKPSAPATSGQSCDSLIVKIDSLGVAFTLRADIPAANSALQQNLADYIASKLFMPEDSIAAPTYNGDLHTFLKDCARIKWQEMESDTFDGYPEALGPDDDGITAAEAREMAAMAAATDSIFLSSGETAFRMVYDDDSLASWQYDYFYYNQETAHPSMGVAGITMRKGDGRVLMHNDLLHGTDNAEFRLLLKEALRQWIADNWEQPTDTDEELRDCLSPDVTADLDNLPLPVDPPFLTRDGIALPYDDGELLWNACMPVLPYGKVRPFLNM